MPSPARTELSSPPAPAWGDSGLPDFRGPEGFWQTYPALSKRRLRFEDMADRKPSAASRAWRGDSTASPESLPAHHTPRRFNLLRRIGHLFPHGWFVTTSNVDGHFQMTGFRQDRICEIHGSIHHLQCLDGCFSDVWSAEDLKAEIDEGECLWTARLPACPHCGGWRGRTY